MFLGSSTPLGARLIWKTAAPPRVRFFFWLVLHDRCWTAARRFRHGLQDSDTCILCDQAPETMDHILLGCAYSREVWSICFRRLGWTHLVPPADAPVMEWWTSCRKLVPKATRRGFDSTFFLIGWLLWKERNARTFQAISTAPTRLASLIKDEFEMWCRAGVRPLCALAAATGLLS